MTQANEEYDDDMLEDMEDDDIQASLFWSLKVSVSEPAEIAEPVIPNYIVHVTKACFGAKVTPGSRTVLMCGIEDDEAVTQYTPVCVLRTNGSENVPLDLVFNECASFKVTGTKPCEVFLSGYLQPSFDVDGVADPETMVDPSRMEDAMDEDVEDAEDSKMNSPALVEDGEDDAEEELPAAKRRKLDKQAQAKVTAKQNKPNGNSANGAAATANGASAKKKSPKNKPVATPTPTQEAAADSAESKPVKLTKKQRKALRKKQNEEAAAAKAAKQAAAAATPTPKPAEAEAEAPAKAQQKPKKKKKGKKKMAGGLEYKDVKEGGNAAIKKGDKVFVYYIGQLASNQSIFDKTLSGEGFSFTVGAGEVIKGWDMGLVGMKGKGSKRKLWIPAKLAYGKQAQAGIPANSQLLFTIEVQKVQ